MKKIILVLFLAVAIISCSDAKPNTTNVAVKASVDSFVSNWEHNWNKHDSADVRNMFLADAVLIDDDLVTTIAD